MQTDQLMSILEDTIDNKSQLIQPIIAQVNLQNTKSKVQLLQRLSGKFFIFSILIPFIFSFDNARRATECG